MPNNFALHLDAALTQPVSPTNPIAAVIQGVGSYDIPVWLGYSVSGRKIQDSTAPGVTPIVVSLEDADTGGGFTASGVKLATSQSGLDSAVAGSPLSLGTTVLSGALNAFPFWVRVTTETDTPAIYTDIGLVLSQVVEVAA